MELLRTITDMDILGTEGLSEAAPRLAARAVLRDRAGLYALMYTADFGLYTLPGGGIDAGETAPDALRRELLEETGCACGALRELGAVFENRACLDFTQLSYYYVAVGERSGRGPRLTGEERERGMAVQWHPFPELLRLVSAPAHSTAQRRYIQARDMAALEAYAALPPGLR